MTDAGHIRGGAAAMRGLVLASGAALFAAWVSPALAAGPPAEAAAACLPQTLAGVYVARHMEVAGALELQPGGRFRYQLSYGALDEAASGKWDCDAGAVYLTGDPVDPPRFVLLGADAAPKGQLTIALDVPDGISRQNFAVLVRGAGGEAALYNFTDDGLKLTLPPGAQVRSVVPLLPVYEFAGDPIPVTDAGAALRLRFDAHDLGKVAFTHTALKRDGVQLVLQRHGETIDFARDRQEGDEAPGSGSSPSVTFTVSGPQGQIRPKD